MSEASRSSIHLTMRDGVRIAIDLFLPALESTQKIPTALYADRYHRADEIPEGTPERLLEVAHLFNSNGYALVLIDARGTGASFGSRNAEVSKAELEDDREVMNWIVAQAWSSGRIGAFGISYTGDTAEMVTTLHHPALKAIAPGFNDFDVYEDLFSPGGVYNQWFGNLWFGLNNVLDEMPGSLEFAMQELGLDSPEAVRAEIPRVRPVDGPDGLALREAAILEHAANVNGAELLSQMPFKDDVSGEVSYTSLANGHRLEIESSNMPMLVLAGWQDAGTAAGTLNRYVSFSNHQEVYIGAWSHGGGFNCDPFVADGTPPNPTLEVQNELLIQFFDRFVKGNETPQPGFKRLHYATNGETQWRTLEGWNPNVKPELWYLEANNALSRIAPTSSSGADSFITNFEAGTGEESRWRTQSGGGLVAYPSWSDHQHLSYLSKPLEQDLRVFGFPRVRLQVKSSTPDGAIYAYLEDVAPDGTERLITEGQLRLIHRKLATRNPVERSMRTPRSFARADAQNVIPGEVMTLEFDLIPTATLFKEGHCIRLSLAGHDKDTFARYAEDGQEYLIERNRLMVSSLELPVLHLEVNSPNSKLSNQ